MSNINKIIEQIKSHCDNGILSDTCTSDRCFENIEDKLADLQEAYNSLNKENEELREQLEDAHLVAHQNGENFIRAKGDIQHLEEKLEKEREDRANDNQLNYESMKLCADARDNFEKGLNTANEKISELQARIEELEKPDYYHCPDLDKGSECIEDVFTGYGVILNVVYEFHASALVDVKYAYAHLVDEGEIEVKTFDDKETADKDLEALKGLESEG